MKLTVQKKAITSVALISMTDVVFLLLIFLLITSNFVTYTGMGIDIPTSQNVHSQMQKNLQLSINSKEEIFVNGKVVSREHLVPTLQEEIEQNPDIVVMIAADQNIALKRVVDLIDASKSAGASKFFIAAQLLR